METLAELDVPPSCTASGAYAVSGTATAAPGKAVRLWRLATGNTVVSVADQVIVSGVNFATVVAVGRFCSKEELGIYSLAFSGLLLVRCVQETLMTGPYIYLRHRREDRGAGYAGSVLVHHVTLTALAVCGLLAAAGVVHLGGYRWPLLPLVLLMAGVGPLILLRDFARQMSFAHLEIRRCLLLDGTAAAAQLSGVAALIALQRLGVGSVYLVIGIATGIPSLVWLWGNRQRFRVTAGQWTRDWVENWNFGRWLLAGHLLGSVAPFVVPWALVMTDHGVEAVGLLAASAGVAGLSNTLMMGLNNLLSAKAAAAYARGGIDALQRVLVETALLLVGVLACFTLLFLVMGSWIAAALYGASYAEAGPIIAILSFGMLLLGMSIAAGNGLCVLGRPSANLRADAAGFITLAAALAVLLVPYGVKGAAVATVSANAAGMAVRVFTYRQLAQQHRRSPSAERAVPT